MSWLDGKRRLMLAFLASEGALLPWGEESHLSLAVGKSMNV